MRRKGLADSQAAVEQEESIEVNLDGKEGENITRHPARGTVQRAKPADSFNADEWEQKNKHVRKRLAQQARAFEQKQADQEAEFKRELAIRDERLARLERGGDATSTDDAAHQKVMDQFEEDIASAQEEGDSKKVAKLTRQMTEADSKFWALKTAKQTGGAAKTDAAKGGNGAGAGNGAAAAARPGVITPTKEGQKWAKANADWFDDKTDRTCVAARAYCNALYKDKIDAGDDHDEPEFYEEIRADVAKRFPEIETISTLKNRRQADPGDEGDDDDDDAGQQPAAQRRAPSLSLPNRGDPKNNRANRLATITSAEQRQMRAVGLDPSNNKHVMSWIGSRNEMEQQEA